MSGKYFGKGAWPGVGNFSLLYTCSLALFRILYFRINVFPMKRSSIPSLVIPPTKVRRIMLENEDVGRVESSCPAVMSKATQVFLSELIKDSFSHASTKGIKTISKEVIENVVSSNCEKYRLLLPNLTTVCPDATVLRNSVEKPSSLVTTTLPIDRFVDDENANV